MYEYLILNHFKKQLKALVKKDPGLKRRLINELEGFKIEQSVSLGKKIYKIRIARRGEGKSGGYRVVLILRVENNLIIPVCVYAKNERNNVSFKELTHHLEMIKRELLEF